jgi:hypothetical protein
VSTGTRTERRLAAFAGREGADFPLGAGGARPLGLRAAGPLSDFLASAGPKAERLLASFQLSASVAQEILSATLQVLVWKWETVRDREAWLLAVLEGRCRAAVSGPTSPAPQAAERRSHGEAVRSRHSL